MSAPLFCFWSLCEAFWQHIQHPPTATNPELQPGGGVGARLVAGGSLSRGVPTHGAQPRLRDPVSTARNGTQGWRGNTCLSQSVLLALPIGPSKIHRHIAFPSSQMEDAPGPRVHHKTGTPTPCLAQKLITLKEKEGERGRKTLSAYLRV